MGRAKSTDASKHNWIEPQHFPPDVEVLYLKASEGNHHTDPQVRNYYLAAKAAGKLVSFYHYFRGEQTLQSQLDRLEVSIKGMKPDVALAGDFEAEGTPGQVQGFMLMLQDFQNQLVSWKRPSIIYTSPGWWNLHVGYAGLSWQNNYDLWVAQYPNSRILFNGSWIPEYFQPHLPYGFKKWLMWQWTDKGLMTGYLNYEGDPDHYGGNVDKNVINMTLEEYKKYYTPIPTTVPISPVAKFPLVGENMNSFNKVYKRNITTDDSLVHLYSNEVPSGKTWVVQSAALFTKKAGIRVALSVVGPEQTFDAGAAPYLFNGKTEENLLALWSGHLQLSAGSRIVAVFANNDNPRLAFDASLSINIAELP